MTLQARPLPELTPDDRFAVTYSLAGTEAEATQQAEAICLEQTVELPASLVPARSVSAGLVGHLETLDPLPDPLGGARQAQSGAARFRAVISYPYSAVAGELTQFLNVLFGNTSLKPGIRVEAIRMGDGWGSLGFPGPRFGAQGLREVLGEPERPLLATALKPMGLGTDRLAAMALACARGGIDVVKDDHGLTDQAFSRFEERVAACSEAVAEANADTGYRSVYAPNVTGPADEVLDRAIRARQLGAGALLISPGLTGWDSMRLLAASPSVCLPLLCHPALLGGFVSSPTSGIAHAVLFGLLVRLAGGDASIFPSFGGRFSFSRDECASIAEACATPLAGVRPILPSPAGGLTLAAIPASLEVYGNEALFLVGAGLISHGPDLAENARYFRDLVSASRR